MNRLRSNLWAALLLVALGFNLGIGLAAIAQAQSETSTYLPLVAHGAGAAQIVTLIDHDTTFVAAALVPDTCRVILTYIDRANGNRLHVAEDVGDRLVEVPMPQGAMLAGAEDEFPGLKHASGFPIMTCGRLRVYANTRIVESGPFVLQRLEMAIPAPVR